MRLLFVASLLATATGCATVQDGPAQPGAQVRPTDPDSRYGMWPAGPPAQPPNPSVTGGNPVGQNTVRNLEMQGGGGRTPR